MFPNKRDSDVGYESLAVECILLFRSMPFGRSFLFYMSSSLDKAQCASTDRVHVMGVLCFWCSCP